MCWPFHNWSFYCRLPLLLLVSSLFASIDVVTVAADETSTIVHAKEGESLTIPPLIKIGSVGDRVRELQATLNQNLKGQIIALGTPERLKLSLTR